MKPDPNFLILLVDDDPNLMDILSRASQRTFPEARFIQMYNTGEAKAYLSDLDGYGPKLILLDVDLQEKVTGLDFLTFLRADSQTRTLPVVMLTVSELETDVRDAYAYGVSSFTSKPTSYEGWITYMQNLRNYWLDTVTLLPIRFHKQD